MAAGLVDRPSQRHRYEFQVRQQARVIRRGQGGEKMVLLWTVGSGHKQSPEFQSQLRDYISLAERIVRHQNNNIIEQSIYLLPVTTSCFDRKGRRMSIFSI
jgi:hypothetical protein